MKLWREVQLPRVEKERNPTLKVGFHVVLVMNLYQATDTRLRDEQDNRLLPHQIRRPRQMEKNPSKVQATEDKALRTKGAGFFADKKMS